MACSNFIFVSDGPRDYHVGPMSYGNNLEWAIQAATPGANDEIPLVNSQAKVVGIVALMPSYNGSPMGTVSFFGYQPVEPAAPAGKEIGVCLQKIPQQGKPSRYRPHNERLGIGW